MPPVAAAAVEWCYHKVARTNPTPSEWDFFVNASNPALELYSRNIHSVPHHVAPRDSPVILPLSDLYPTCQRCGGDCVHLAPICRDHNKMEEEWSLDYVACQECNGLGGRLTRGGKLLLELMKLNRDEYAATGANAAYSAI